MIGYPEPEAGEIEAIEAEDRRRAERIARSVTASGPCPTREHTWIRRDGHPVVCSRCDHTPVEAATVNAYRGVA